MKIKIIFLICFLFLLFPSIVYADDTELNLHSPSSILIDSKTGKVLYEKDANKRMYPASTTKILNAILVLENCENLQDTTVASYQAVMDVPTRVCFHSFCRWRGVYN